jgi:hypothetical protein
MPHNPSCATCDWKGTSRRSSGRKIYLIDRGEAPVRSMNELVTVLIKRRSFLSKCASDILAGCNLLTMVAQ